MSEFIVNRQNGKGKYIYADGTVVPVDNSTVYEGLTYDLRSYGPRLVDGMPDNILAIAFEEMKRLGFAPVLSTLPFAAPQVNPKTGEAIVNLNIRYRPPYFRAAAAAYMGINAEERKTFLVDQLEKLTLSWNQYSGEIAALQAEAAKLDGQNSVSTWAASIGGLAIATANPYAVGAGAVLTAASLVVGWVQKRKDGTALKGLQARAVVVAAEANEIAAFHAAYTKELSPAVGVGSLLLLGCGAFAISQVLEA